MKLNIGFVGTGPLRPTVEVVKRAEALGINGVSYSEHAGWHDGVVPSTLFVENTSRIEVITLGLSSGERHPAITAMELASLSELANGRIRAQVGTGAITMLKRVCADMHLPVSRVRSMVETLRALLDGQQLTGHYPSGSFNKFQLLQLDGTEIKPAERRRIPIDIMAVRPKMIQLAAQVGDGVVFTGSVSNEYLRYAVKLVEDELRAAGRDRKSFRITALAFGVITRKYRDHYPILRLLLETYAPVLAKSTMRGVIDGRQYQLDMTEEFLDSAEEEHLFSKTGKKYFTPDVIDQLTVAAAGVDDLTKVLKRYADTGIDVLDVHLVGPLDTHIYAVEALATAIENVH